MFSSSRDADPETRTPPLDGLRVAPHPDRATAFDADPGTLADRIGTRFGRRHPVSIAFLVALAGYVLVTLLLVGLGLLLIHVLSHGPVGRWDHGVNQWFAARRTSTLNPWTAYGSFVGGTLGVVGVAAIAVGVLAIRRLWREIGLLFLGLVVETSVFLTTMAMIKRPRPNVPKLEGSITSSFPSGHTAAAIVLYVGLALIVSSHSRRIVIRVFFWLLAAVMPVVVALSRLYRGMHHPTDIAASVLLGAMALLVALLAVRSGSAATQHRPVRAERNVRKAEVKT
jgi:undecaprenyl-diphosphatase